VGPFSEVGVEGGGELKASPTSARRKGDFEGLGHPILGLWGGSGERISGGGGGMAFYKRMVCRGGGLRVVAK